LCAREKTVTSKEEVPPPKIMIKTVFIRSKQPKMLVPKTITTFLFCKEGLSNIRGSCHFSDTNEDAGANLTTNIQAKVQLSFFFCRKTKRKIQ